MSSFGHVPDLLDERYLKRLKDVVGNAEPMPKLVPYDEYKQSIIVYRMDSDHDQFAFLIQEFTKRMSSLLGKELWTWYVQWEVDNSSAPMPTPKKPRLQFPQHEVHVPENHTPNRKPIIDQVGRAVIDPELIQEEEMLRALINIVQVESSMVPNVVEWLYRWIDYLEGDGMALRAALKWEIPSLWDFDHHPLVVSGEMKRRLEEENAELIKEKDAINSNTNGPPGTTLNKARELIQDSPTKKMRQKPSLAALEQNIEESERLKYREVRYGIRPPKDEQPLPPLFNIPLDEDKRKKYYDACYRSRHRALVLLLEAGITLQQISSYKKSQSAHPRNTPVDEYDKELMGLKHYRKDAEAGQDYFKIREKRQQTLKQTEIAMTDELANEGRQSARAGIQPRSYVTDIPHAPIYVPELDVASNLLSKIRAAKAKAVDTINFVPTPLVGGLKSKYLALARDRREMKIPVMPDYRALGPPPDPSYPWYSRDASDSGEDSGEGDSDDDESDEEEEDGDEGDEDEEEGDEGDEADDDGHDSDEDDDEDDDDENNDGSGNHVPSSAHFASVLPSIHPYTSPSAARSSVQPPVLTFRRPTTMVPRPVQFSPIQAPTGPTRMEREELDHLLSVLEASTQAPVPENASSGPAYRALPGMASANFNQTNNSLPTRQMPNPANTSRLAGGAGPSQAPGASIPLRPPTLTMPALRPVAPGPQRPALPGQPGNPRQVQPPNSIAPAISGPGRWTMEHFQINSRIRPPPAPAPSNPPISYAPNAERQQNSNHHNMNSQPPQVSRPPQGTMSMPPVLGFSPLPSRSNGALPVNMNSMMGPQAGLQQSHSDQSHLQQARSPLPAQNSGQSFNMNHTLALRREQQMQIQALQQQNSNPLRTTNQYAAPAMQPPRLQFSATQSQRPQAQVVQPPTQHFASMQPPRLQFSSTQNRFQNLTPTSSWSAAPPYPQHPTAPAMTMNTPTFSPPLQSNQQQPNAQASRARSMLQAAIRPTVPQPVLRPAPPLNTGRILNQVTTPGIQRNAPTPLTLQPLNPHPDPLTSLADSILATTPFRSTARGTPIQIYFPKIVIPGNGIGPGGTKLGDNYHIETDALLLGHTIAGSGAITLERALFMPLGCWTNTLKRVRAGHADVLETYSSNYSFDGRKMCEPLPCHVAAYAKLSQALGFMTRVPRLREELLTKRWRVTAGPMTQIDRGAVWEGWGVGIDRPMGMTRAEREGVMRMKWVVDDGSERTRSVSEERKWKEMEDFMEEEGESWDFDDEDGVEDMVFE